MSIDAVIGGTDDQFYFEDRDQLIRFHSTEQFKLEMPFKIIGLISIQASTLLVALTLRISSIFLNLLFGFSCGVVGSMLVNMIILKFVDQANAKAILALSKPGFYRHALNNPRQLASAENINRAFERYVKDVD